MENVNKNCMEQILQRLTTLICLLELEDIDVMDKLVNLSALVSAQLLATQKYEEMEFSDSQEVYEEQEY